MHNLKLILKELAKKRHDLERPYFIPQVWNEIGYGEMVIEAGREGQIGVNPYAFMETCIREAILPRALNDIDYLKPLSAFNVSGDLNPAKHVIYAMLPRMFTAWDHYDAGKLCSGTFLKAICLLPYLKMLQVDIIYLLPVFKNSEMYKKGELGSPYAIKNFYQLDPHLHDDLLGGDAGKMVETEFKAFIEACHILGIRVMLDFVFRTVARDNDLLLTHPEWFYWIDLQKDQPFLPPVVGTQGKTRRLSSKSLKKLYTSQGIHEYLGRFRDCPAQLDPKKWRQVLEEYQGGSVNMLTLIEREFKMTTAPAFSDVINDSQPPWTDVTYLQFYLDGNPKARTYLSAGQAPYVLHDIACLNRYQGLVPNQGLWDYCLEVIPYYQDYYGIDGARIDMGHALPPELNQKIINRVKVKNNQFILWSEEFAPEKSQAAKDDGFHFISGNLWSVYNGVDRPRFYKKLRKVMDQAVLPVAAALETPDTPRMALIYRKKSRMTLMICLNFLTANAIPFINNGLELLEIQPMNLGLNNDESGRFVLEETDPMYGKLAFFDPYRLHWLNEEQQWMRTLLMKVLTLRKEFSDLLEEPGCLIGDPLRIKNPKLLFLWYYAPASGRNLFFLANKHRYERAKIRLDSLFPETIAKNYQRIRWLWGEGDLSEIKPDIRQRKFLAPEEVVIGCLE